MKITLTVITPAETLTVIAQEARRQAAFHLNSASGERLARKKADSISRMDALNQFATFIDSIAVEAADAAS